MEPFLEILLLSKIVFVCSSRETSVAQKESQKWRGTKNSQTLRKTKIVPIVWMLTSKYSQFFEIVNNYCSQNKLKITPWIKRSGNEVIATELKPTTTYFVNKHSINWYVTWWKHTKSENTRSLMEMRILG